MKTLSFGVNFPPWVVGYDAGRMAQGLVAILRDPMVRTVLAVIAICITVALFLVARRRKRLGYMLSDARVLGVHEAAVSPSRVTILFDGAAVTDVRLVVITVNNPGNEPIRAEDFERPLRFRWAEPARILTAEVVEVNPETLQPTVNAGVNEIVLEPLLLNPGDWFRIKTLINQVGKLSVEARVVGVKRITKTIANDKVTSDRTLRLLAVMGFVGVVLVLLMSAGQGLGLWVANGLAEKRVTQVFVLGMLFLMAEELKAAVLGLVSYYKNKDDSK